MAEEGIGNDLGTSYSCVGLWQHDHVKIIANDQGNRTTPSYVAFTDTERLIGDAAMKQVAMNPINTVFGLWQQNHVEIITNDQGNCTPFYVTFTDTERLLGDAAMKQVAMNPINTVFDAKRLIGRRFSDTSVQSNIKLWPFMVIPGPGDDPMIVVQYKDKREACHMDSSGDANEHVACHIFEIKAYQDVTASRMQRCSRSYGVQYGVLSPLF